MTLSLTQQAAVDATDQDILALACAGSGKTRTLIERIARRVEVDTSPSAIMAITFTNKAAEEMRERLAARLGPRRASQVWMGTFHAFGNHVLQTFHEQAGFPDAVSIYGTDDVTDVLRLCVHQLGVPVAAKSPDAEAFRAAAERAGKTETLGALYRATLRRYAATDYDGLETHLLELLPNPHVAEYVGWFRECLVDEYQDTNPTQEEILVQFRAVVPGLRIVRVGDEVQAVYGFRGATIENIQRAAEAPGMRLVRLATNYRSGAAIVEAGNRIAAAAGSHLGRVEPAEGAGPGHLRKSVHQDAAARAAAIADEVEAYVAVGGAPADVMILGRSWAPLEAVTEALVARGLPVANPKQDSDRWGSEPMRWLVAAMKLWRNPRDGISLRRVLRWPASAGTEAQVARAEASAPGRPVLESVRAMGLGAERLAFLGAGAPFCDPHTFAARLVAESDAQRVLLERGLVSRLAELNGVVELLREWVETRVQDERAGRASSATTIRAFLQWYAFREVRDAQKRGEGAEGVQVLTIHAAKGLEAPVVHFVGPDLGVFPRHGEDPAGEELRLWYVAVTRARDVFHAHVANEIPKGWGSGVQHAGPSPFVEYLEG